MYVTTKFEIGDECYFLDEHNRPCKSKIICIHVSQDTKKSSVEYTVCKGKDDWDVYAEEYLCRTDWELKDKLMSNLIEFV